jgi:hypothetical protein
MIQRTTEDKMESLLDKQQLRNQKMFELIRMFRDKISSFDTSKYRKNANKAAELRTKGNELFAKGLYEESLQVYTEVESLACPFKFHIIHQNDLSSSTGFHSGSHGGQR